MDQKTSMKKKNPVIIGLTFIAISILIAGLFYAPGIGMIFISAAMLTHLIYSED